MTELGGLEVMIFKATFKYSAPVSQNTHSTSDGRINSVQESNHKKQINTLCGKL
jgi:hypothetical protein